MWMKRNKYAYTTAKDGLEAYDAYRTASVPFKTIFMGMTNLFLDHDSPVLSTM